MVFESKRDRNGKLLPWVCPRCSRVTNKYPALSRRDNETGVCPDCGVDEAMFDFFTDLKSKKKPSWKR